MTLNDLLYRLNSMKEQFGGLEVVIEDNYGYQHGIKEVSRDKDSFTEDKLVIVLEIDID